VRNGARPDNLFEWALIRAGLVPTPFLDTFIGLLCHAEARFEAGDSTLRASLGCQVADGYLGGRGKNALVRFAYST
jgi:hypothetical protein